MPNHVTHRVVITGAATELHRFVALCIVSGMTTVPDHYDEAQRAAFVPQPYTEFDFGKLVPKPAILDRTISPAQHGPNGRLMLYKDGASDGLSQIMAGSVEATEEQEAEIRATGFTNWYDWSITNWGTKWGAYDSELVDDGIDEDGTYEFTFQTAWSPPAPIFRKLRELFPDLTFDIAYFDEGWNFAGRGRFNGGVDEEVGEQTANDELYQYVYGEPPEHDDEDADPEDETIPGDLEEGTENEEEEG